MMSPALLAIFLSLFSAITVAAANFAVKRGGDVLTARMVLSISMALTVVPFIPFVPAPPTALWPSLIFAVIVHWVYQFGLIRALHRGDLSRVFPVMRGAAPLLVAIAATFYLDEHLAPLGWLGLLMATGAVIAFATPEDKTASKAQTALDRSALIWAGFTALGICAYSIVDASVIRQMPSPYTFIVYLFLLDWIGITAVTLWTRRGQIMKHVKPQRPGRYGWHPFLWRGALCVHLNRCSARHRLARDIRRLGRLDGRCLAERRLWPTPCHRSKCSGNGFNFDAGHKRARLKATSFKFFYSKMHSLHAASET